MRFPREGNVRGSYAINDVVYGAQWAGLDEYDDRRLIAARRDNEEELRMWQMRKPGHRPGSLMPGED